MGEAEEREERRERHVELHRMLDELIAGFLMTRQDKVRALEQTTIIEFMHWSYEQTLKPTERGEKNGRDEEPSKEGRSNEEGD